MTDVIEKKPFLLIRYEATGILFERALSGDEITHENIRAAEVFLESLALKPKIFEANDFPAEAEKKLHGRYWDEMVESVRRSFEEDAAEEEIEGFKIGDRVRYIGNDRDFDGEPLKDLVATIVKLDTREPQNIGLWFDENISGHSLDETRKGECGWYVNQWEIEHINKKDFQKGDIVRYVGAHQSLKGLVGVVEKPTDDHGDILVNFFNWTDGHDGGIEDGAGSRWWVGPEELEDA